MPSSYPGGLDDFPNDAALEGNTLDDILGDASKDHTSWMDDVGAAIEAIEGELGLDPAGASATVVARLDALDTTVAGKQTLDADLTTLSTAFASAAATTAASLAFHEGTNNGTNKITVAGVASVTADKTLTLPDATDTLVGKATTDTLTNKTIALGSNTVSGTTAEFNTALSDGDFATLAGTETLTGKTIDLTSNTLVGSVAEFNTALESADFYTTGGTDVAVADGGTGASTAADARTNLGVAIGSDVQAFDADLADLASRWAAAAVTTAASLAFRERTDSGTNQITVKPADSAIASDKTLTLPDATDTLVGKATTDTLTNKTIALGSNTVSGTTAEFNTANTDANFYTTSGTDVAVADGGTGASTAADARTNLGVAIGTDVQAWDAALDDFAGLTQATDTLPYFDTATTMATTSFTAFARTLLDDANAAAAIATLGALAVGDVTVDIQEFSASGTWTKPTNALTVLAVLVGGGGGGAAGNVGAEGTLRYGGGGGMAGAFTVVTVDAADCAATEAVTIGAGGAGGTGGTSATGNPGTDGGDTLFNTTLGDVTALGGNAGSHGGGFTPGAGGGRDQPTGYNIARDSTIGAGLGGAGAPSTGSLSTFIKGGGASWCGGGGGGVNRTAANANEGAGAGGNGALGAGGAVGNPGSAGGAGSKHLGGGGGGGGSAATANGGAGGTPGGAGGGGGYGITSSSNSGSGGAGANGYAAIFTICAKAS